MILIYASLSFFIYLFIVRLLRWLALWQQKEYRLDRFWVYMRSHEGRNEMKRILHFPFKKSQLKRPKFTPKIILILATTLIILSQSNLESPIILGGIYLLIPVYIIIGTIPAWVGSYLVLKILERRASNLIKKVNPDIIGVSGSYGKTTTKLLIGQVLSQQYPVWISPKSHNTALSIAQAILKTYKRQEIVVMEYAAYKKGEISYLAYRYHPDKAVFTGLNLQHLALFGSKKNMLLAETELFGQLKPKSKLYFNDHDALVSEQVKQFTQLETIPTSRVKILHPQIDSNGYLSFRLPEVDKTVRTKLMGSHYLTNIQQTINVAQDYNISSNLIAQALTNFEPGEEFMRLHTAHNGAKLIIDDRTANPDGFKAALDVVEQVKAKTRIVITEGIIDLGYKEAQVHQNIAEYANKRVDYLIHVSDTASQSLYQVLGDKYIKIHSLPQLQLFLDQHLTRQGALLIEGHIPINMHQYLVSL